MIKLLVPDMPSADDLLPYLRRIDAARVYVNRGPLVQELEARLESITSVPCVTVSNGTVALELALNCAKRMGGTAHMPALTFSATGLAAHRAGLRVKLHDVAEDAWQMGAAQLGFKHTGDVIVPVATFGRPVETEQWENYHFPVVIDAAGAFPDQQCSRDPNIATCFSMHATKFIGCGEGGFVASANKELIEKVRDLSMFGKGGTNAKMSEYHAVVALASLDRMSGKWKCEERVTDWYVRHGEGLQLSSHGTLMNVLLPIVVTPELINDLRAAGIETKQWYRPYLDERAEFGAHQEGKFPVTNHLRTHLLGLPFHNFLTEADVAHVCETLRRILK